MKTSHTPDYPSKAAKILALVYLCGVGSGWLAAMWAMAVGLFG